MLNKVATIIFLSLFLLVGCKTGKVGGTADCPKKDAEELITLLKSKSETKFTFYYSKISCKVIDSEKSQSFKTTLKMQPDSALSGVLKVAGIIGAAYLADQDTVAFTNKLKKCYFKKDYQILADQFGMDLNYKLLEDMILGKPFGLTDSTQLYPKKDDSLYVLASHDKKMMKKLAENNLSDTESSELFIQYKLDCGTLKLAQIEINAPAMLTHIIINYIERQEIEGSDLPKQTVIKIENPKDTTIINLNYGKPTLNSKKSVKINIPSSYSECK
jgi:hypothetical protein